MLLSRALVVTALATGCGGAIEPPREGQPPPELLPPREGPPPDIGPPREGPPPEIVPPREGPVPLCESLSVTDETGAPLPDVEVTFSDGRTLRTNASGRVTVSLREKMSIHHPGYEPAENVTCGEIQLQPTGKVLVPADAPTSEPAD